MIYSRQCSSAASCFCVLIAIFDKVIFHRKVLRFCPHRYDTFHWKGLTRFAASTFSLYSFICHENTNLKKNGYVKFDRLSCLRSQTGNCTWVNFPSLLLISRRQIKFFKVSKNYKEIFGLFIKWGILKYNLNSQINIFWYSIQQLWKNTLNIFTDWQNLDKNSLFYDLK